MSLAALASYLAYPGLTAAYNNSSLGNTTSQTLDAAGEYQSVVLQAREDMVISHVAVRPSTVTGSGSLDIRIETVDASGLPSGTLWATNTNVVTGALTSSTVQKFALGASATISKGQFFAIKMVLDSGTSVILQRLLGSRWGFRNLPFQVTNTSGSAVKSQMADVQLMGLGSSSTSFYCVDGLLIGQTFTTTTFNNSTAGDKRGVRFKLPFAARCVGLTAALFANLGDFKIALYDDAGSELASSETAVDGNYQAGVSNGGVSALYFDHAVYLKPDTWYRATLEPTTTTNIAIGTAALSSSDYKGAWPWGLDDHYTTYTTAGGWVDTATTTKVGTMDLLFDMIGSGPTGLHPIEQGLAA